jgi:type VI secretion system VasD/TssJ family lipoprotein
MTRIAVLLALLPALAACSSTSNHEVRFRGDEKMNPNEDHLPNTVKVKVLQLKGQAAATKFQDSDFDELWSDPQKVLAAGLYEAPMTIDVLPGKEPKVGLEKMPPEVTHIGVLALFNQPTKGKDRAVVECAQVDGRELWLHDYVIEARDPNQKAAEKSAEKPPVDGKQAEPKAPAKGG